MKFAGRFEVHLFPKYFNSLKQFETVKYITAVYINCCSHSYRTKLFIKSFTFRPGAEYPDRGCSFETYTDAQILELESLGPLTTLQPGASVEHVEHWHLVRDVPPVGREADVSAHVLPHLPAPQPV